MTDQEPPKIAFPCDYPIKVIFEASEVTIEEIFEIAVRHDPSLDRDEATLRPSARGNYHAVTLRFTATGERQLKALFEELKTCDAVRMVL